MKKYKFYNAMLIIFILLIIPSVLAAQLQPKFKLGGGVALWDPPGESNFAPIFEVWGEYYLSYLFSARGTGAYSFWGEDSIDYTHRRVTVDALFHPYIRDEINLGLGGGLGFYQTQTSIENDQDDGTLGLQGLGTFAYQPASAVLLELNVRAILPDINESSEITWQVGGGLVGEIEFGN
ncbi:MAG: hypothetical protein APR63_10050 [Desulfuromonas sp. SDB]|nr:MAG: hypothetical protein APR63_10050 [Desulfuromonas sp. SDB]